MQWSLLKFIVIILFFFPTFSKADWWHHNSFLVGTVAPSVGGAFTAIANTPAAVFYNPAGIVFAKETEVTVSTNTVYNSTITQQGFLGNNTSKFILTDSDFISGILGSVMRFDFSIPVTFAIALYNKDYINLESNIRSFDSNNTINSNFIQNVHSTDNVYAVAVAFPVSEDMSLGLTLGAFNIQYSEIQTAINIHGPFPNPDSPGNNLHLVENWIYYSDWYVRGLEVGIGSIYKPYENLSLGLSGKYRFILNQGAKSNLNDNSVLTDINFVPLGSNSYQAEQFLNQNHPKNFDKIFDQLPFMIRAGFAYSPAEFQTFSGDIIFHSKADSPNGFYRLKSVFDFAFGSQTNVFDLFNFNLGFFTNNWCGDPSVEDQFINVNFNGYTAGINYTRGNTLYSVTFLTQISKPEAEYKLEAFYSTGNNNPKVNWQSFMLNFGMSSEIE